MEAPAALLYFHLVSVSPAHLLPVQMCHIQLSTCPAADVAVVCLESVDNEAERRHLAARLGKTHTIVDITRAQVRQQGWLDKAPWVPWQALPTCCSCSGGSCSGWHSCRTSTCGRRLPPPTFAPALRARALQMAALCGNVLELEDGRGLPVLAMSTRAYNAFTEDQKRVLRWVGGWVGWAAADVDGGRSAVAELLPLPVMCAGFPCFSPALDSSPSPSPCPVRRRHVAALHHANIDTLEHIGGGGVRCTLAELF